MQLKTLIKSKVTTCVMTGATDMVVFLSTHADRKGLDISFTVCLLVCVYVCTVTDFSAEDKASDITFCTAVHRRP